MIPLFPTPETISRPCIAATRRTALANSGPSREAAASISRASSWSTRRASACRASSESAVTAILQVLRERCVVLAAGAEQVDDHFTHRPLPAGKGGDMVHQSLHLGDRIGHADREARAPQHRDVGEIITDPGELLPAEPFPCQD